MKVISGLLAAGLLSFALAAADATGKASPGPAAGPESADPVQEKFRRLQHEMAADPAGNTGAANRSAADAKGGEEKAPEARGLFSLSMQILLGLAFVLILAVVTIRFLKRIQGRMLSRPGQARGEIFEVLETCHLGAQQRVVAVRMRDEVGILGVTSQGIALLGMLKEPAEEVRRDLSAAGNPAAFSESLNKLLGRFKKPKRVSDLLDEA